MSAAFAASLPVVTTRVSAPAVCSRPSGRRASSRTTPVSMASVSRPSTKTDIFDDVSVETGPATTPEIAAVAPSVCEFMNEEHLKDISNYVVKFGKNFDDLSQLTAVRMTNLDQTGFTADVVSCDDSQCVCVQEHVHWPLGLCHNAADIVTALKHLSMLCGLPADF